MKELQQAQSLQEAWGEPPSPGDRSKSSVDGVKVGTGTSLICPCHVICTCFLTLGQDACACMFSPTTLSVDRPPSPHDCVMNCRTRCGGYFALATRPDHPEERGRCGVGEPQGGHARRCVGEDAPCCGAVTNSPRRQRRKAASIRLSCTVCVLPWLAVDSAQSSFRDSGDLDQRFHACPLRTPGSVRGVFSVAADN